MSCDVLVSTVSLICYLIFSMVSYHTWVEILKLILPIERVTPEPYYFIHYKTMNLLLEFSNINS